MVIAGRECVVVWCGVCGVGGAGAGRWSVGGSVGGGDSMIVHG